MKKLFSLFLGLTVAITGISQINNGSQTGTISQTSTTPSNLQSSTPASYPVYNAVTQTVMQPQLTPAAQAPSFSGSGVHHCATHNLNQQHYADRGLLQQFNQESYAAAQNISTSGFQRTPGVNEISVIFHVVHNPNNPAENVSNALIMQVYNDLVEDFLLLNANAANARTGAPFNFTPANPNINFCLATKDPLDNPLTELGVVRVATTEDWYDSNGGEENKMKAAATGGSDIWDRNDYLNIWICDISNGAGSGTAGYAYRPTPTLLPGAAIDGIVLDYNLGVNNENVLTHEVGHYLGLDHPWGGSGGCGNDDGFADTPLTTGPSFDYPGSCSGSQQTCGVEVQYENYMDYANCTVMFTTEQSNYMLSILQGIRSSLLLSPGCDPVDAPPVVDFTADIPDPIIIPVGGTINFFSQATNNPTSWTWDFSGGSPNQTVENPTTVWNTIGLYTVTHTATNAFGTGTETKIDHVQVVPGATGIQCDTLRNYNPADPLYIVTNAGNNTYISGNMLLGAETSDQWAEPYTAPLSTQVRRLEVVPSAVNDAGGNVIFKVYGPGVTPGAVLATETVPLANFAVGQLEQIDFTTPATVTGNFWVGYELSYAGTDTFALLATVDGGTNFLYHEQSASGWSAINPPFASNYATRMDVLTSNGPAPVADFSFSDFEICAGGDITVNGSISQNTTDYLWFVTDNPVTTIFEIQTGPNHTFNHPAAGNESIYLFADGSCMTDAVVLNVTINPTVAATVNITHTSCGNNNGSISLTGVTGGDGNYEYSLDGNTWQTGSTFNNLPAGNYTVYIQTPGDNCQTTYNVTINPSTVFTATVGPSFAFCVGGTATLTASGGVTYEWYDGNTLIASTASTNVTPATTTQYSCIVTNAAGCQSTVYQTVNVYDPPAAPVITATGPTSFCNGGSVDLTSDQATGNTWNPGAQTTQTITVTTSGTYDVTLTDINGCTATSNAITITVNADPAIPTITASGPLTVCNGGSVDLTSSYATGNVWSPGSQTTQTITVNTSGSYTVTHTDANGCSSTSAATVVTVEPGVTLSAGTITDPTACSASDGSIVVNGTGTGTISWTGTAAGNSGAGVALPYTITGLAAGSYTIDFVSDAGCPATNTLNETLTDPAGPAAPVITAGGPTTFCAGGSVDLTSSYATGNVWNPGAQTTQTITVSASGTYDVTYTDINGCSSTSTSVTITVEPPVTLSSTFTDPTTCAGTDGTITISGTGTGQVNWTGTAAGSSPVSTTLPYTITGLAAGTYNIDFVTATGCTNTLPGAVTLTDPAGPTAPVITASGPTALCPGNSVDLTSSQATGNVWTPTGAVSQTINVTTAGTYSVTYTDINGCTSTSAPITVTVFADPTIGPGAITNPSVCGAADGSIEVIGVATGDLSWTGAATGNANGVTLPHTITGLAAGSYDISFVSTDGCTSNTITVAVVDGTAPPAPTITASGPTTFCAGGSVDLTSSYATGNDWSPTGQTTQTITVTTSGSYTVTYTDGAGCTAVSTPIVVTVNSAPAAPTISLSGPTSFCTGGSVDLTSSQATGNVWNPGAQTTQTITVNAAGTYDVTYTDVNGCTATSTPVTITVNSAPAAPTVTPSGPTTFCAGGSVDLTSSEATGNDWSTTATSQTVTITASGSYTVTYTDPNGCTSTSTATVVTVNPLPVAPTITTSGSTQICQGQTVDLISSQATGNTWSTTETTQTITVGTTGSYTVTFTDANGCTATSTSVDVNADNGPTVSGGPDITVCLGDDVTLSGSGANTYTWNNGATDNVAFTTTTSGTTEYVVTGIDASGCQGTDTVQVIVNDAPTVTVVPDLTTTCVDHAPVGLVGSPAGGVYLGAHVNNGQFDPTSAGVGTHTVYYEFINAEGCLGSGSATIVVEPCASIAEQDGVEARVFPNPMQNILHVELEGNFKVQLMDARGRVVYTGEGLDEMEIDTYDYQAGMYILQVTSEQFNGTIRVIKD